MAGMSSSLRQALTWPYTSRFCCRVFRWGSPLIDISPLNSAHLLMARQWTRTSPWHPLQQNLLWCYFPSFFSLFQPEPVNCFLSSLSSLVDLRIATPCRPRSLSSHDVDLPTRPLASTSTEYSFALHPLSLHSATRSAYFAFLLFPVPPPMALSAQSVLLTPSQVVRHPCSPCATALTLSSCCSILVTSATTRSFLSFLLACLV